MTFMIGIYKIENKISNKKYIGSSINLTKRFERHKYDLIRNKHINIHLQRDFNKCGISNFSFECIEVCDNNNLREIEQLYLNEIFKLKNHNRLYYNIGKDASGGDNLTNNPNRDNIIDKISKGLYKKYENETEEDKIKRSDNLKGEKNPNYGNKWSTKQKEKMSIQRKGLKSNRKGKTYEELFGTKKANLIKYKIKKSKPDQSGEKNPNFGNKCPGKLKEYYSKLFSGKRNKNILNNFKPFEINNKTYILLKDAEKDLNIPYLTIRNRLLSDNKKFINYQYLTDTKKINKIKNDYIKKYF